MTIRFLYPLLLLTILPLTTVGCGTQLGSGPSAPRDVTKIQNAKQKPPVFPVIKAHDWNHMNIALHEPFEGLDGSDAPQIGYGYNAADNYVFLTNRDGRSLVDVRSEAMKNIVTWEAKWAPVVPGVLTASGTDLSSEKILDTAFLVAAQKELGAKRILVAIPRRTVIYAGNAGMEASDRERFMKVVELTYLDDSYGNAPISNLVFVYEDGKLVAHSDEVASKSIMCS